ncbi:MAG: WG repeat-containing protein [Oscillospiraceae bacterium]|nr:WG repeat-containing protein [Oscillospiraceae bacterium]
MKNRIISFGLTVIMLLAILPASVAAVESYTVAVPFGKYYSIDNFQSGGVAMVYDKDWNCGLIDESGAEIVPIGKYAFIDSFSEGLATIYNEDGGTGVINSSGAEVVPVGKYDYITPFSGGGAFVYDIDSNVGVINASGRETITIGRYRAFDGISEGMAIACDDSDMVCVVDVATGNEIVAPGKYDVISAFSGGVAVAAVGKVSVETVIPSVTDADSLRDKYLSELERTDGVVFSVIDKTGKEIVAPGKYDLIYDFSDGMALAIKKDSGGEVLSAVIDTGGKEVIPLGPYMMFPNYIFDEAFGAQGMAMLSSVLGDLYNGKLVTDGVAVVFDKSGRSGVIDTSGKMVVPFGRYNVLSFSGGMAAVLTALSEESLFGLTEETILNGDMALFTGIIDTTGKELIPRGEYLSIAISDGVAVVHKTDGTCAVYDNTGKELIPSGKRFIMAFNNGRALAVNASLAGLFQITDAPEAGIIDKTGAMVIPFGAYDFIMEDAYSWYNGGDMAVVRNSSGQYGVISLTSAQGAPGLESADTWAHPYINEAYGKGFIPAELQGNYKAPVTRGEFVRLAMSWLNYKTGKTDDQLLSEKGLTRGTFNDTADPVLLAAAALKITDGSGGGMFGEGIEFDRQQAAVMIAAVYRVLGEDTANAPDFGYPDINVAAFWARSAINFVGGKGAMTTVDGQNFGPNQTFSRQQSITVFNAMK